MFLCFLLHFSCQEFYSCQDQKQQATHKEDNNNNNWFKKVTKNNVKLCLA